jgi:DNA-binding NtrC family response regulator
VLLRYARSLSAYGYAVDFAHDDAEVARLGREKEFDVVINDIDMRNCCDGHSLRQLRRENKRVPVVVLSGCLAFASARAALDCGAHKYLVKPVSDERLLEVLVDAVQDAAARLH